MAHYCSCEGMWTALCVVLSVVSDDVYSQQLTHQTPPSNTIENCASFFPKTWNGNGLVE